MNKKIVVVLSVVLILFLTLSVYLTYFGLFSSSELEKSVYNQRLYEKEDDVLRGTIYDRNGEILAKSEKGEGGQKRIYPYGKIYTHVIGYSSRTYGRSKLELSYNDYLSGANEIGQAMNIASAMAGDKKSGFDLTLTIDNSLQRYAYDCLSGKNGSIIVMDSSSGAIRALASNPTFEPDEESLMKNWENLTKRDDAPFVARATSGLYAPGSTWKIVTATKAVNEGFTDRVYNDEGKVIIGGREYVNSKGKSYGEISLREAFLHSSNVVFASIGNEMGKDGLSIYEKFLLGENVDFDISLENSRLSDKINSMSEADIASTAIGQGKLMVTPLYMTMVASSIANDGEMIMPYLVENAKKGSVYAYRAKRKVVSRVTDEQTALVIRDMMRGCVKEGTGKSADVYGLDVYGKTGTAQNEKDKSHDWFIGFAENEKGEGCTVCIMLEYNGKGSSESAYIASRIFSYWLK